MACVSCGSRNVREGEKTLRKITMLCNDCGQSYQIKNPAFGHALIAGATAGAAGATISSTAAGQEVASTVSETVKTATEGAAETSSSAIQEFVSWIF